MGTEFGVGAGITGIGAENVVDDVKDAVGEKDILLQDTGRVDEDRVGREAERDGPAIPGRQRCPVEEAVTVLDTMGAVDDVVVQQVRELLHGQAGEGGATALKGIVVRREDGDVCMRVDVRLQRGIRDRAPHCGEVERRACTCEAHGRDEERVDRVYDAAIELDVLDLEKGRG